jgi:hypothetical protein
MNKFTHMELNEILALPVMRRDLDEEISIRQYLYDLMSTLWTETDGFDGKRPFGNSGWDYEVYASLIKHGLIPGSLDEDGYIEKMDEVEANNFVINNILKPLFGV